MTSPQSAPAACGTRRFTLATTPFVVAGRQLELAHPQSIDELIDAGLDDPDDRLPYWGTIWPSARVLARRIAAQSGRGRRLLDLGCGVGPLSLAAALAGFDVLATDYYGEACEMTAANADRNGIAGVRTRVVDWRAWPAELSGFPFVVASDVLYERPNPALVAEVFARSLAPTASAGWPIRAADRPGRSPPSAASGV